MLPCSAALRIIQFMILLLTLVVQSNQDVLQARCPNLEEIHRKDKRPGGQAHEVPVCSSRGATSDCQWKGIFLMKTSINTVDMIRDAAEGWAGPHDPCRLACSERQGWGSDRAFRILKLGEQQGMEVTPDRGTPSLKRGQQYQTGRSGGRCLV